MDRTTNVPEHAFIPKELIIKDHPELKIFSFNIMFGKYGVKDGKTVWGNAIYEPDLNTFKDNGEKICLRYPNKYGGNSYVDIVYDKTTKSYIGHKFVNEKRIGSGMGADWNNFFVHLTMLGLSTGEMCKFSDIESMIKKK